MKVVWNGSFNWHGEVNKVSVQAASRWEAWYLATKLLATRYNRCPIHMRLYFKPDSDRYVLREVRRKKPS